MPATVTAASTALLSCVNVSVRAGQREVVSSFNWQHQSGGIAWLFGSNGSGKSSLLRVLAGFQLPASGHVHWTGEMSKVHFLTPDMSAPVDVRVCDFLDLVQSLGSGVDNAELQLLLPRLGHEGNRFRTLSTGEAKRFLLWSILRQPPQPLILDEPYEHLSREAKAVLTVLLQRWAEQSIVVIATNQDVPMRPEDTLLTLDGTRLEVSNAG
jgi:heme exporter protein A